MSDSKTRWSNREDGLLDLEDEPRVSRRPAIAPGKVTLTSRLPARSTSLAEVQHKASTPQPPVAGAENEAAVADDSAAHDHQSSTDAILEAAAYGVVGSSRALPHLDTIQRSFGQHDVSGVRAHVGGRAACAAESMGAEAYATGNDVGFRDTPTLHTAAHEAAHVVQQRAGVQLLGGVGEVGDRYEAHADAVADRVVRGQSAEHLLDQMAGPPRGGVQMAATWGRAAAAPSRPSLWGRAGVATGTRAPAAQFFKGKTGGDADAPKADSGDGGSTDPAEAKKAEEEAKALADFKKQTYSQKNHVPSTGYGAFDVEYQPMPGALNITVRTDFQFKDSAKAKWANGAGLLGMVERAVNQTVWIMQYQAHIAKRWGNQYTMNCVKKYWDSLIANTNVNVVYDPANPHFRLTVVKMAPGDFNPNSAIDVPSTWQYKKYDKQQPGFTPAWGGTLGGELGSTDATELEPDVETASAKTVEPERMRAHMPQKVLFANDSAEVSAADADALETFGTMLSMTRHPKLSVNLVGRASTSGDEAHNLALSTRRSTNVAEAIRRGGTITHDLNASAKGEAGAGAGDEWRRVDLSIDDLPKTWTNDYDIGSHEFGHQIGLDEEYDRGTDGVVPDHFKLVEEAFGKEVASTFVRQDENTASVMSAGLDVRPFHYVTFWEALGRVTSPTLTRADWKIQA